MLLRCPHCSKEINMTLEELASGGGRVVCPQCLGEFDPGVDLSGVVPGHRSMKAQAPMQAQPQAAMRYCPHCGKALPADGLNFCPFCGQSLNFGPQQPATGPQPEPAAGTRVAQEDASEPALHEAPAGQDEGPTIGNAPYVKAYRYMPELKSHELKEQPASLPVQVVCWVVIVALAALFVWIVWLGNQG